MTITIHVLKTDDECWDDVADGRKEFEIRADDRTPEFTQGDVVVLTCGPGVKYGARLVRRIGYLYRGRHAPAGVCVFQLTPALAGDDLRAAMACGDVVVSS